MSQIIVFSGNRCVAQGELGDALKAAREALTADPETPVQAFEMLTSRPVDLDLRQDIPLAFSAPAQTGERPKSRGRPKLGVEAREVTLMPRHWEWLSGQRAGASATLRRLVEEARRADAKAGSMREGKESLYRFITAIAGDAPGYEEAIRALFSGDAVKFEAEIADWPTDVRAHALSLLGPALGRTPSPLDGIIPKDRLEAVRRVIETALPGRDVEGVERMSMGLSGAGVFKVTVRGTPYVLRLDNASGPYSDPTRQYSAQAAAAEAGVAPALLHADVDSRISLSRFSNTAPYPDSRAEVLIQLGEAIRRLHSTPRFKESLPWFSALDQIFGALGQADILPIDAFAPAMKAYANFKARYPAMEMVSTHHDLNPGNVLFTDEGFVFVDWETASCADPYVDLAGAINWFTADDSEVDILLSAYLGRDPDATERRRAWLMRQVNRLFFGSLLLLTALRAQPNSKVEGSELAAIPPFSELRDEMASLATTKGQIRLGCAFFKEGSAALTGQSGVTVLEQLAS